MIKNGADVAADDNFGVRWASIYGRIEVVRLLIEHSADVTANNNDAILWASKNGHLKVVKLLIEHGADVTAGGNSAIQNASRYGYLEVVKVLIEHGADVTAGGNSAIRNASRYGHLKVVKVLIRHGATPKYLLERELSDLFGSPKKAVLELPQSMKSALPLLLHRMFNKTRTTPMQYIRQCPDWQKSEALKCIVS
jgi:ankyrin repeat protein